MTLSEGTEPLGHLGMALRPSFDSMVAFKRWRWLWDTGRGSLHCSAPTPRQHHEYQPDHVHPGPVTSGGDGNQSSGQIALLLLNLVLLNCEAALCGA